MSAVLQNKPLEIPTTKVLAPMEMRGWWGVLTLAFYPALILWILIPLRLEIFQVLATWVGGDGLELLINLYYLSASLLVLIVSTGIARAMVAAVGIWRRHERVKRWLHSAEIPASSIKERLTALLAYDLPFVVYRDTEPRAFVLGIWTTRIYVSTRLLDLLDDNELGSVIMHEVHHHRNRDPLKGFALTILSHLFFYLPAIQSYVRYWNESREWDADSAAKRVSDANILAEALCKILTTGRTNFGFGQVDAPVQAMAVNPAALHGLGKIRDRIEFLLGLQQPGPWKLSAKDFGLTALSLLAFAMLVVGMMPPVDMQPQVPTATGTGP